MNKQIIEAIKTINEYFKENKIFWDLSDKLDAILETPEVEESFNQCTCETPERGDAVYFCEGCGGVKKCKEPEEDI